MQKGYREVWFEAREWQKGPNYGWLSATINEIHYLELFFFEPFIAQKINRPSAPELRSGKSAPRKKDAGVP